MRWLIFMALAGCATPAEQEAERVWSGHALSREESEVGSGLAAYQARATSGHPDVLRRDAQWEAAHERVALARRLPDPRASVGTMTGSHGMMLSQAGVSQQLPWTAKLSRRADANAMTAHAAAWRLEGTQASLALAVAEAYWSLWQVRANRALQREHVALVSALAENVRGRVATGAATVADLQQVEVRAARMRDTVDALDETERGVVARLRSLVPDVAEFATPDEPILHVVREEALDALVAQHPEVRAVREVARALDAQAMAEENAGMPDFSVDLAWRFQEEVLMVGAGMTLPIWRGDYTRAADGYRAESVATNYEAQARTLALRAQADMWLSVLRDSARRVALVQSTLLPQAEAAYASVLGAYAVGKAGVAAVLLAQQDFVELSKDLVDARVRHEVAYAQLIYLLGDIQTQEGR